MPLSETFIYAYIVNQQRYQPIVISEYAINQDRFPVPHLITHRRPNIWYEKGLKILRNYLVQYVPRELFMSRFYERAVRESDAQVMHVHFGVPGMMLLPIKRRLELPMLVSFYGYDLSQAPSALGEDLYRRTGLFQIGEAFTAEGGHARRCLLELGCPEEKAHVLHIGVDLDRFSFVPRVLKNGERPRVLFCGRFVEKKGLLYALQALARVQRAGYDFEFMVIGDGPQSLQARKLVDDLQLQDQARFLGIVSHDELSRWYQGCHIFLAPSATDLATGETEGGAPTVLLEAQATGMPVASTTHADIPEVVRHGETGLLAPERDVEMLAQHLIWLIDHPEQWPQIGERGRAHIMAEYNIRTQAQRLESLYDEICDGADV